MKEKGTKGIEKEGLQISLANKLLIFQPMQGDGSTVAKQIIRAVKSARNRKYFQ